MILVESAKGRRQTTHQAAQLPELAFLSPITHWLRQQCLDITQLHSVSSTVQHILVCLIKTKAILYALAFLNAIKNKTFAVSSHAVSFDAPPTLLIIHAKKAECLTCCRTARTSRLVRCSICL